MLAEWLPLQLYHGHAGWARSKPLILKGDISPDMELLWSLKLCAAA